MHTHHFDTSTASKSTQTDTTEQAHCKCVKFRNRTRISRKTCVSNTIQAKTVGNEKKMRFGFQNTFFEEIDANSDVRRVFAFKDTSVTLP